MKLKLPAATAHWAATTSTIVCSATCWNKTTFSKLNEQDSQLLLSLVRTAKEKLTTQTEAVIKTTLSDGHKVHTVITRQEFHNLTQNLVQKTIEPVKQALKDAGVTKADARV